MQNPSNHTKTWANTVKYIYTRAPSALFIQDDEGKTPIRLLIEFGIAKPDLLAYFVDATRGRALRTEDAEGNRLLHCISDQTPLAVVKWIISRDRNSLLARNNERNVPLHCCIMNSCDEFARLLIDENPVAATRRNLQGEYPVHKLTSSCSSKLLRMLWRAGPTAFRRVPEGDSVLHRCAREGVGGDVLALIFRYNPALLDMVDSRGRGRYPSDYIFENGPSDAIASLLKERPAEAGRNDANGNTPLLRRLRSDHMPFELRDTITSFVEADEEALNTPGADGNFALQCVLTHHARTSPDADTYAMLCTESAAKAITGNGETPLHLLRSNTPRATVQTLVDQFSESLGMRNGDGNLPLHCCVLVGNNPAAQLLLTRRPELAGWRNGKGECPVHLIQRGTSLETVEMLFGAFPRAFALTTDASDSVLHRIVREGASPEVLQYILEHQDAPILQRLCQPNLARQRPLHCIRKGTPSEVVAMLLRRDAGSVSQRDPNGNTPLHIFLSQKGKNPRDALWIIKLFRYHHPGVLTIQNDRGDVPLHCHIGNTEPFCRYRPFNDRDPTTHSQYECDTLQLLSDGDAAAIPNRRGEYPLHLINASTSPSMVELLLKQFPGASIKKDCEGSLPWTRSASSGAGVDSVFALMRLGMPGTIIGLDGALERRRPEAAEREGTHSDKCKRPRPDSVAGPAKKRRRG